MADSEQRAASAADTPPQPQSLGTILKQARIARDLSLEQVSTELRIEVRQLDALEQDRFERIGVPVFVKGYLRQYGTLLGLEVPDLLLLYYKQTSLQEVRIQPSKTIKLHDERQITVWIIAALVLAALVVALAVWWWNGGGFGIGRVVPATRASTAPAAAARATAAVPVPAPVAIPAATDAVVATSPPPSVADAVPVTALSEARSVPSTATPAAAPGVALRATETAAAARDAEPAGDDRRGVSLTAALQVTFEQESWAEISDARGERLFYGLGVAGRNAKLSGEPPFAVVLGNSAGVKITLDGEDFPVPTNGKPGDYSRFSVDVVEE